MGMDQMGSGGSPPPSGTDTASASGTTHTIIVAPTKGVLRFGMYSLLSSLSGQRSYHLVPFATTANSGDTLHFVWGAGPVSPALS